ncbi:MAG: hypothetical protein SGPRY_003879, partial [Prymnesium sp.]
MTAIADGDPMTGTCKWFNVEKGYGFISVDDNENDIFVHQSDIYAPGFRSLAEGEQASPALLSSLARDLTTSSMTIHPLCALCPQLEFRVQTDAKTGKLKAVEVTG